MEDKMEQINMKLTAFLFNADIEMFERTELIRRLHKLTDMYTDLKFVPSHGVKAIAKALFDGFVLALDNECGFTGDAVNQVVEIARMMRDYRIETLEAC